MKVKLHLERRNRTIVFLLICFMISFFGFSQTNFYTGPLTQNAWNSFITEINNKKVSLQTKITQAENMSLETSYARGTIISADEFVKYATRDRNNAIALQTKYQGTGYGFWNGLFETKIENEGYPSGTLFSQYHPFHQLFECVKILDKAEIEIDNQLSGTITLPETLDFTTPSLPTLPTNSNYYQKDGNIVFPSTFWGLRDDVPELLETVGYLGEVFHSPGNTSIGTFNGDANAIVTNPGYANNIANRITSQVNNNQTPTQVHFTQNNLSAAITNKYPGIGNFPRAFVRYDINHPNLREMNESILGTYIPQISAAAGNSELIYVLSNEPHWNIAEGSSQAGTGVSNNTYNAYVNHLQNEYGTIAALNAVYNPFNGNQNFTNFNNLRTSYTIPLNRDSWQGTPIWYDWLRFNMNRSNNWHQDLKDITRDNDPDAKVSIKILGRELEDPRRDGGIDIEALMDLQDVIGFDNQVVPNETHGRNNRFEPYRDYYIANYIMDWREQSIMLDFARSMYPNKPTFDSEWHGMSSNAWNNHALDTGYTRSALWSAFTNGLGVINNWWWYRDNNGDLLNKTNTVGNTMFSVQHQPVGFEEFSRTMKELNAQSSTIASLTSNERDYLIYYSAEAAIQDWDYMQQVSIIYEALKVQNVKIGFTTENKINSLSYSPQAIIVPPTLFIKDSSIDALNTFRTNNASVDILQINRFNPAQQNYIKDEKGTPDTSRNTFFANKNFTFSTNINALITRFRNNLAIPNPEIDFDIVLPGTSTEAFGVFAAEGNTPNNKKAMSLINLSVGDREIQLSQAVTNLITGEIINSGHIMKPYDVLLVTDNNTLTNQDIKKPSKKSYVYFPNPANTILTIKNTYQGTYNLYNTTGALVKTVTSKNDSVQIQVDQLSEGIYFLEIPTAQGKRTEKIIVRK